MSGTQLKINKYYCVIDECLSMPANMFTFTPSVIGAHGVKVLHDTSVPCLQIGASRKMWRDKESCKRVTRGE